MHEGHTRRLHGLGIAYGNLVITCVLVLCRDKLSYLAPLGSDNISAPYFKQCFFRGRITPPD